MHSETSIKKQHMETEKIIFYRNFLLRTFFIGLALAVLLMAATLVLWDDLAPWVGRVFMLGEGELGELTINFFLNLRILLLFCMLAPALALHSMIRRAAAGAPRV